MASRSLRQKLSTALETGRRPHILLTSHPHLIFQEIKLSATWAVLEAQGHHCTPTQKRKQVMCPQNSPLCQYGLHQRGAIRGTVRHMCPQGQSQERAGGLLRTLGGVLQSPSVSLPHCRSPAPIPSSRMRSTQKFWKNTFLATVVIS